MSQWDSDIPSAITRKLAQGARQNEKAIVVGRRDGTIEWANAAWTRVTGYPLHESVSKPVVSFLENVEIEAGVVDFVGTCFREGRLCEVEFPLVTPSGESLWIQLRVEPLFSEQGGSERSGVSEGGEPSDFIAIATDITSRKGAANSLVTEVDLSEVATRVARRYGHVLGPRTALDGSLPNDLPPVLGDADVIEGLVGRAMCRGARAIGDGWGTVTLWSGIVGCDLGPLFLGDLWRGLPEGLFAFLEIHDTGGMPMGPSAGRSSEPFLSVHHAEDVVTFAEARARLQAWGGELRLQNAPAGTGTSVVLLLPLAMG